jgi:hypothetical protein
MREGFVSPRKLGGSKPSPLNERQSAIAAIVAAGSSVAMLPCHERDRKIMVNGARNGCGQRLAFDVVPEWSGCPRAK